MKNIDKEKGSRRHFLTEGMKAGTSLLAGVLPDVEEDDQVKMLTPDGKVVLVSKKRIKSNNQKTKNKDILQWIDNHSNKSK